MARKKPHFHADAHVLERARMTDAEFQKINLDLKDTLNAARAHCGKAQLPKGVRAATAPLSNTGGKYINPIKLLLDGGKIKEVLPRSHYESKTAFTDWLNVTVHETTFEFMANGVTDAEIIMACSLACDSIFGFGITAKRERGANFYHSSYDLGNGFGLVCYGGQRNTVLIMLNGEGCSAARHGWERRMHDFLDSAQNGKITRIDIAHDDITGDFFNMNMLEKAYDEGGFNAGGNNPDIELRGNWKNPNGKGRTINIGHRTNGKFCRCYEKGCQLGAKLSPWVRCEVEFKSVDRIIPFDCLLYPHEYLGASYPIFANLTKECVRIATTQKTVELSYDRTKKWLTRQCGSALNMVYKLEGSDALLELLREGKPPKGVVFPSFLDVTDSLHNQPLKHGVSPLLIQLSE